jgi:anti-sigma regulatory factor (Ser/Thr protein kinase)
MSPSSTLQHGVLAYSGPRGFTDAAVEMTAGALSAGATAVIFADAEQIAQVRTELGRDATAVVAIDRSVAGRNPARVLPALQTLVDANREAGVRCIGDPVRADDSAAVRSEVALHELILQLPAFRAWNCQLTCAYDDSLDPGVVDRITVCHDAHSDPSDAVDRARAEPLPTRPIDSEELGVDRTTLSALRGFIEGRAAKAGLDDERVDDLVYAVNEIVTNSICHGEGRARVSFWTGENDGSVTCEVRDRGWIRDPLAGRIAPHPDRPSGRGLWLVNQLCDLVQLRSSPAGTTVRLHIDG